MGKGLIFQIFNRERNGFFEAFCRTREPGSPVKCGSEVEQGFIVIRMLLKVTLIGGDRLFVVFLYEQPIGLVCAGR